MGSRRKSRELALQVLFQLDLNPGGKDWQDVFWKVHPAAMEVREFTASLVEGVLRFRTDIDRLIEKSALNWKMNRISNVDRNILRTAIFELLHMEDIPSSVTINEAIEIAKKFSDDKAGAFINGILDQIVKEETVANRGA